MVHRRAIDGLRPEAIAFSQLGGARIGLLKFSWPFARLRIDGDSVSLSVPFYTMRVPRGGARLSARRGHGLLGSSLTIRRDEPGSLRHVIFWTPALDALVAALERNGHDLVREQ